MKTLLLVPALLTVAASFAGAAPAEIQASVDPATVPKEVATSDKEFLASQAPSAPAPIAEAPSATRSSAIEPREAPARPAPERAKSRTVARSSGDYATRVETAPRQDARVTREDRVVAPSRTAQSAESVTVNPAPRVTKERRTTTRSRVVADPGVADDEAIAPDVVVDSRPVVRYVPSDEIVDDYRDDDRPRRIRSIQIERGIPVDEEVHHEHHTKIGRFFHRIFND